MTNPVAILHACPYTFFECYMCKKADCPFSEKVDVRYTLITSKREFHSRLQQQGRWYSTRDRWTRDQSISSKKVAESCCCSGSYYYYAQEPVGVPSPEQEHRGYEEWTTWICRDCSVSFIDQLNPDGQCDL